MFVLYAFLVSVGFVFASFVCFKTFQLEGYKIKNYIKSVTSLNFAFGKKNKLVFTFRIKRLIFASFLLDFAYFLLFFGLIQNFWINFLLTIVMLILNPLTIILSFLIMDPIEKYIKQRFIKKAKAKLERSACKKIAITGSFGKTSTKNILFQILKEEFDVCATPKSFNTPMGICKTILENLKETDDFFVMEFGARQSKDIEYLAKMVGVDFGIMTPIGNCHLETFETVENIENTKYELCENTKDFVVFNGKSESTKKLYSRFKRKKYLVCVKDSFAYAKNIEVFESGSKFTLVIDGKEFECSSRLLGSINIDNIVVASAMAYLLGENIFNIQKAIAKVTPTPHRLELIDGEVVKVIDDSYNSNYDGFLEALNVLKSFDGRKVVVSPGIVELGKDQYKVNFQAGAAVAKVADIFVVMNKTNKEALYQGAIAGGIKEDKIYLADSRVEQTKLLKNILHKGDVVLFENDFPDNIK